MSKTVDDIFVSADLPKEGNEDIYERAQEILVETMAELSVATATKQITWRQRLDAYESQKQSLIEELVEFKKQQ